MTAQRVSVLVVEIKGKIYVSRPDGYLPKDIRWDFSDAVPSELDYIYRCWIVNQWLPY